MIAAFATLASAVDLPGRYPLSPSFAEGSLSGLDVPDISRKPTLRLGSALLYEERPVRQPDPGRAILFDDQTALFVGGTASTKRVSLSIGASAAVRWGLDLTPPSLEQLSSGTLYTSARVVAVDTEHLRIGLRASFAATTFASDRLDGPRAPALGVGLLASHPFGPILLATDIGPRGYTESDTAVSPLWLDWRTGARLTLPEATRFTPIAQLLARVPIVAPLEPNNRAPSALVGVELYPSRAWTIVFEGGGGLPWSGRTRDWFASSQIVWRRVRADPRRSLSDGVYSFGYEIAPHPYIPPPPPSFFDPHDHIPDSAGCAVLVEIARAIESDELFDEAGALSLHAQDVLEVIAEEARAHIYGTVWVSDETAVPERCAEVTVRAALFLSFLLDLGVDPARARYVDGCAEPRAREPLDDSLEIRLRIVEPSPE